MGFGQKAYQAPPTNYEARRAVTFKCLKDTRCITDTLIGITNTPNILTINVNITSCSGTASGDILTCSVTYIITSVVYNTTTYTSSYTIPSCLNPLYLPTNISTYDSANDYYIPISTGSPSLTFNNETIPINTSITTTINYKVSDTSQPLYVGCGAYFNNLCSTDSPINMVVNSNEMLVNIN